MSFYQAIAKQLSTDEGQCILLLGPELCVDEKGIYYKSHFKELALKENRSIKEYLERENIFTFNGEHGEDSMRDAIFSFYEKTGDITLLELAARIKFPLIINVFPDKSINSIYKKNHISFVYDYLCSAENQNNEGTKYSFKASGNPGEFVQSRENIELQTPSRELPVIYNIFGDYEVTESMIYNHQTLYESIEYLMAKDALPEKIRNFIKKANCFIFLGFDFDSWHYHLMCHKLGLGKKSKKISYGSHVDPNEKNRVSIVMKEYFKVSFVEENPTHTLQELIKELNNNPLFRHSLRAPSTNQFYSVFISYAWKDKQSDILELLNNVLTNKKVTDDDKIAYLRQLLVKSGKLVGQDTDIGWLLTSGISTNGESIEEWYNKLPSNAATTNGTDKVLLYNREFVVDQIEKKLHAAGVTVFRDKKEMTYGDSIDSFMTRIGTGKAVIRVVSDKYLKSRYCMDEALRIRRYADNEKRVFTIVLKDDIDLQFAENNGKGDINLTDEDSILYKQYWETMVENIYGKINSGISNVLDKERTKKNFSIYIDIYDYIMDFIAGIKDEVHSELQAGAGSASCLSINQTKQISEQEEKINAFVKVIETKLKDKPENS